MITYYGGYFGTVPNLTISKGRLKLDLGKNSTTRVNFLGELISIRNTSEMLFKDNL